jgi:magnesium-transporting ATPase (P-type)
MKLFLRILNNDNISICISGRAFSKILQKVKEDIYLEDVMSNKKKGKVLLLDYLKNNKNNNKKDKSNNKNHKNKSNNININKKQIQETINYKNNEEIYRDLIKEIDKKGKIFYRMNPFNKVDLVNFFKEERTNIVAMCGDGANDCGALLSSDVGISIGHREGYNITSHFFSSEESISCIETIIKNGRACYENNIILFKYMVLYAMIQMMNTINLYLIFSDFEFINYLFQDFFLTLLPCLLASK